MRPIPPDATATLHVTVTEAMTVRFDELGPLHGVYATYSLARHFEEAGRKLLLPYLDVGENGLGSELSVRHSASALPGMRITVTATLDRVEGRALYTQLRAVSELGDPIGSGHTVQIVLPQARIDVAFEALRARWHGTAPDDLRDVTELDAFWNEAYIQNEPLRLAPVLADDWLGHFPDGSVTTREEWLHAAPDLQEARYTFSEQWVRVYGDTAVSKGHLDVRTERGGHRQRYLRVWARRGGHWQAVAVHVSLAL